jgi:hypothetical protein
MEMLQRKILSVPEEETNSSEEVLDPRVLSSVLVSTKLNRTFDESSNNDPHARLLELMHSAPIKVLLQSAQNFSSQSGIPAQEGLQQIIMNLQEIDALWSRVLLKEGLARLSSQYH